METITSAWRRISVWYDANTPQGTLVLAPGASEAEISDFEKEIGFTLPADLRASFAQYNGAANGAYLLHHGELLSLKQILHLRQQYLQWQNEENWGLGPDYEAESVEEGIKPIWWNSFRLPLTDNSGDAAMADFDPATGGQFGQIGQIIEFDHEIGPHRLFASSFGEWLTKLADGLENNEYIYYPQETTVGPPGIW